MLTPVLNAAHFNNELFFADSRNNNVIKENILKKYTSLFHDQQKYPPIISPPNQPEFTFCTNTNYPRWFNKLPKWPTGYHAFPLEVVWLIGLIIVSSEHYDILHSHTSKILC